MRLVILSDRDWFRKSKKDTATAYKIWRSVIFQDLVACHNDKLDGEGRRCDNLSLGKVSDI
ncbi:hypothetical protein [Persicitalea sp.]|uniref:hypothetical protein n=1 Tax=Persicitalea sp. TaxID=3100273 RepID=UPI0035945E0B